jgi:hypothetical protein
MRARAARIISANRTIFFPTNPFRKAERVSLNARQKGRAREFEPKAFQKGLRKKWCDWRRSFAPRARASLAARLLAAQVALPCRLIRAGVMVAFQVLTSDVCGHTGAIHAHLSAAAALT